MTPTFDFDAFATDLTKALGLTLVQNEAEGYSYYRMIALDEASGLPGLHLWLTPMTKKGKVERMTISLHNPERHKLRTNFAVRFEEITVSVDRPMKALAADIVRRVIGPGKIVNDLFVTTLAAELAERESASTKLADLATALTTMKVTPNEDPAYGGNLYVNDPEAGIYLSGRVSADGSFSGSGGMVSLSRDMLEAINAILASRASR